MIRIAVVGGLNRFLQLLIADVKPQRRIAIGFGKWIFVEIKGPSFLKRCPGAFTIKAL